MASLSMVSTGFLAISLAAGAAAAQVPTSPAPLKTPAGDEIFRGPLEVDGDVSVAERPLVALTRIYTSGNWARVQGLAIEILRTLSCQDGFFKLPSGRACEVGGLAYATGFDFKRDTVLLTWIAQDFKGEPAALSFLVHEGAGEPYKAAFDSSGDGRLYQVFLADQASIQMSARFTSTRTDDPLAAQIPALAAAIVNPLFAFGAKEIGTAAKPFITPENPVEFLRSVTPKEKTPPKPRTEIQHYVQVAEVKLPVHPASVKLEIQLVVPVDPAAFDKSLTTLKSQLDFEDLSDAVCGRRLSAALAKEAGRVARLPECDGSKKDGECLRLFDEAMKSTTAAVKVQCATEGLEVASLPGVEKKFRQAIDGTKAAKVNGDLTLTNASATRLSLGALTSFSFRRGVSAARVKVDSGGKYAADPLPRQLSMVVLNVAAEATLPGVPVKGWARLRGFVGFVVSPDFGIGFGGSWLILPGFGINVGFAVTGIPVAADGKVGDTPKVAEAPFGLGHATMGFFGISLNFK